MTGRPIIERLYNFFIHDFLPLYFQGTTTKRRNDAISRLNSLYLDILPAKKTIQKCLKYLCEKESYRMLKDWSYGGNSDPLQSESEDDTELDNVTEEVIFDISQKISDKRKKSKTPKRRASGKNSQVKLYFFDKMRS